VRFSQLISSHNRGVFAPLWLLGHACILLAGAAIFCLTRRTPRYSEYSMRELFCLTNGRSNELAGSLSGLLHQPYDLQGVDGVLGHLESAQLVTIAADIDANGYHVFETMLNSTKCDELARVANDSTAVLVPTPVGGPKAAKYDRENLLATRYDISQSAMFEHPICQELVADRSFLAVAQTYLGCQPVSDLAALWWTAPHGKAPDSDAAQLFHFDMDRMRFLKFFVYLSDVGPENGPHCFIQGSHKRKPRGLSRDGRISDEEIHQYYADARFVNVYGKRGTIFAADTRGFHKGVVPTSGDRLIFQIEYANSLFGARYDTIPTGEWSAPARADFRRFKRTFERFVS